MSSQNTFARQLETRPRRLDVASARVQPDRPCVFTAEREPKLQEATNKKRATHVPYFHTLGKLFLVMFHKKLVPSLLTVTRCAVVSSVCHLLEVQR